MKALVLALALAACGGHVSESKYAQHVDACALKAEQAFEEDGVSMYEANKIFDRCVAEIP